MSYPTFTSTVASVAADAASLAWTMPSGLAAGQWLVLIVQVDGNTVSIDTPAGYTAYVGGLDIGAAVQGQGKVFRKITDGSEGAGGTATWSGGNEKATVHAILVSDTDTAFAPELGVASGAASDPDPPSKTASWGSDTNLWFAYAATSSASNTASAWTDPSGFTAVQNASAPANDNTGIQSRLAYINETTATKNPGTFNITDDSWAAFTLVFKPVTAVPGLANPTLFAGARQRRFKPLLSM